MVPGHSTPKSSSASSWWVDCSSPYKQTISLFPNQCGTLIHYNTPFTPRRIWHLLLTQSKTYLLRGGLPKFIWDNHQSIPQPMWTHSKMKHSFIIEPRYISSTVPSSGCLLSFPFIILSSILWNCVFGNSPCVSQ